MRHFNINEYLISIIETLYKNVNSAVIVNDTKEDFFRTSVGVRQGCLLSPTLFNIFLEKIMQDTQQQYFNHSLRRIKYL